MWRAMVVLHDAFSKEEVSEQGSDQEVGTVQTREYLSRECRPCTRVRDGSEDPVELTQRCSSIPEVTMQLHHLVCRVLIGSLVCEEEVAQCDVDGRRQARREEVGGKFVARW